MQRRIALLLAGALALLSSCGTQVHLHLEKADSVDIYTAEGQNKRTLPAGTDAYRKLTAWLDRNQSGWQTSYVTPRSGGMTVSIPSSKYHLQFLDDTVLLHGPDGVWTKHVAPDDYAFLKP